MLQWASARFDSLVIFAGWLLTLGTVAGALVISGCLIIAATAYDNASAARMARGERRTLLGVKHDATSDHRT